MQKVKILISGLGLPPHVMGSWLFRIHQFQTNLNYFDYILSPTTKDDERYIFCKKKSLNIWNKFQKPQSQISYAASDYVEACKRLSQGNKPVQIVVMDDSSLLQAICQFRDTFPQGSEIVFSFHGHWLINPNNVLEKVDKVLFLTKSGYRKSFHSNFQFTPQAFVVGNGVEDGLFYPLDTLEKANQKIAMGYKAEDRILIWMANSRRVKGLHLFKKIAGEILKKHPDTKILSIGHQQDNSITHPNWKQLGVLKHEDLAKNLQIGDVYFFTSLWQEGFGLSLVEAMKCGNWAIASNAGGIPEVLADQTRAEIVEDPNIVDSWLEAYTDLLAKMDAEELDFSEMKKQLAGWHSYSDWQTRFYNALTN